MKSVAIQFLINCNSFLPVVFLLLPVEFML